MTLRGLTELMDALRLHADTIALEAGLDEAQACELIEEACSQLAEEYSERLKELRDA